MSREITHMKAFTAALESMGKPAFSIGRIPPTPRLVDQYFNDSTGIGDRGEPDARGPWNEGGDWEFVTAPAFQEFASQIGGHETGCRSRLVREMDTRTPATEGKETGRRREGPKTSRAQEKAKR